MIMHGPIFWYFFIIPGVIFVVEKVKASKMAKVVKFGHMHIKEVNLLASGVSAEK